MSEPSYWDTKSDLYDLFYTDRKFAKNELELLFKLAEPDAFLKDE